MALSTAARRRLGEAFGEDYMVLDLVDAPEDADILLTHPISLQLLGALRERFPRAEVVVTEIDDEEAGVSYLGPVSRLLDAGASAYLPPRPPPAIASAVDAHVRTVRGRDLDGKARTGDFALEAMTDATENRARAR